jgi:starch synthase
VTDPSPADAALVGSDGASETVVHIAAEYWPYARTGGLAEAVQGIAKFQGQRGRPVLVFMPLYRKVREAFPRIEPCGEPFPVEIGQHREMARVWEDPVRAPRDPRVLFIEHDGHFGRPGIYGEGHDYPDNHLRFAFFSKAVLQWLPEVVEAPALIHPHDWHTAFAPVYLRTHFAGDPFYDALGSVLTVHNGGYQGHYQRDVLAAVGLSDELFRWDLMEWYDKVNILKGGLTFSDIVTTVSPTHAHELRTPKGGFGLHDAFTALQDRFVGILNGIDYEAWSPDIDPSIRRRYDADSLAEKAENKAWLQGDLGLTVDPDVPMFGMTARLAGQKGFDLILGSDMISKPDAQWVFLGEGEARYEEALGALAKAWPDRVSGIFHFTEQREHELLAAADFLLMPSQYEPCGLTQMRAQRYGALPVARRVGGLSDTIEDRETGFLFDEYEPWALEEAVRFAIDLYRDRPAWETHVRKAMATDFSWDRSAARYAEVYRRARERREANRA